jgi:hypothetical protein
LDFSDVVTQHAKSCAASGADVYIAGVLITSSNYDEDAAAMERYARDLNMLVGMANHNQLTGGLLPERVPFGQALVCWQGQMKHKML